MARDRDDDLDREDDDYEDRARRRGPAEVVPNYLVQSILVTVCCCLPFGIVAIVQSAKVNSLVAAGDYVAARRASKDAYKWAVIGAIVGAVVIGLYVIFNVVVVAMMANNPNLANPNGANPNVVNPRMAN